MTITNTRTLVAPRLGLGFGTDLINAVRAAQPSPILREPVCFPTSDGDWYLRRVDRFVAYEDSIRLIGAGTHDLNDAADYKVSIEIELQPITREAVISFIS